MVEVWDKKVEALKLYMAQLQEKIRIEVAAREELTKTYEQSLNKGVGQLNDETKQLQENPLIKEISLIVAQELVKKSQVDPQLAHLLSYGGQSHLGGATMSEGGQQQQQEMSQ